MIGTSTKEYIFIRFCIFILQWITPLCILYCILAFAFKIPHFPTQIWILGTFIVVESLFYFLVYLPRKYYLQGPATHPEVLPFDERQELFRLCHENVPDAEAYLSKWFLDAPLAEIKHDNVKEFFHWSFFNNKDLDEAEDQELEGYIRGIDSKLKVKLEPGRGNVKCLSLTIRPVDMLYRSTLWYLCVGLVDALTYIRMLYYSFHFHRTSLLQTLSIFPPRPLALTTTHHSPVKTLSYWHRPHTSNTKLPILFIHGIGIGLYPYVSFLADLSQNDGLNDDDGNVGIIAVEFMPLSFRITHVALGKDEMCNEISRIIKHHNWERFVLVTHSYGSVICAHLLRTPLANRISAILLTDPITFMLHIPDVAYNFTYRKPTHANEHQLYYFASKDMGVAHTLSRRFFWFESIMWKHDIDDRPVTVSLAGRDLIVDTRTVWDYLTLDEIETTRLQSHESTEQTPLLQSSNGVANGHISKSKPKKHRKTPGSWIGARLGYVDDSGGSPALSRKEVEERARKEREWKGEELDVMWFQDCDHAQVFDTKERRKRLVNVVRAYCKHI